MIIACNTATAYGKPQVQELCKIAGFNSKVIGVIDADCLGALEVLDKDEDSTIAILATPATVASMAYLNTLNDLKKGYTGSIPVFQERRKGLHKAIDNKPEFIGASYKGPFLEYQGPSLSGGQYWIHKELLPYYRFETTNHHLLFNKASLAESDTIEISSVENYTPYHIVNLVEKHKASGDTIPLKAIVLGCKHYPYVSGIISKVLGELRETYRYGPMITDSVHLIDPAANTAKELYKYLSDNDLSNDTLEYRVAETRFFLTVPNTFIKEVVTGPDGRFTYDYQYIIRDINELKDFVLTVPFSKANLSEKRMNLIQTRLPVT